MSSAVGELDPHCLSRIGLSVFVIGTGYPTTFATRQSAPLQATYAPEYTSPALAIPPFLIRWRFWQPWCLTLFFIPQASENASSPLSARRSSDQDGASEGRRFSRRGSMDPSRDDGSSRLARLQKQLRRVSVAAHRVWVAWSAEQLTAKFERELQGDEALATTNPLKVRGIRGRWRSV